MGVLNGGAVLKDPSVTMGLRGRKPSEPAGPTKMKNFRLPLYIEEHLKAASQSSRRTETEIVLQAIELDRDLDQMLVSESARIHAVAHRLGLDPDRDLAKVLAGLVRYGLDKAEEEEAAAAAAKSKRSK